MKPIKKIKNIYQEFCKLDAGDKKVVILGTLAVIFGIYLGNGFAAIMNIILSAIGVFMAFAFASSAVDSAIQKFAFYSGKSFYEIRHSTFKDDDVRFTSYLIAVCVLYTACAFTVAIVSSGANEGDVEEATGKVATMDIPPKPLDVQMRWQHNLLFVLFVPTILGVRYSLGAPKKK